MLDLDSCDLISKATIFHDLIELEEIVDLANDLNLSLKCERLSVRGNRLSCLLVDEG